MCVRACVSVCVCVCVCVRECVCVCVCLHRKSVLCNNFLTNGLQVQNLVIVTSGETRSGLTQRTFNSSFSCVFLALVLVIFNDYMNVLLGFIVKSPVVFCLLL